MGSRRFEAALFDLDGVVFNTEPQYAEFWSSQFREFYPNEKGLEFAIKGQTLVEIYDRFFSGPLASERLLITERLCAYERSMSFDYVNGIEDFVKELKSKGIKMAVVTSSDLSKMVIVRQKRPEFFEWMDAVLTAEDFLRSKPDPDCYIKAALRLGIDIKGCVVFEDSFNGLRSGRSAGMATIALATTNPAESLEPLADMVTGDFTQLSYDICLNLLRKDI